jgi:hypothetical protein
MATDVHPTNDASMTGLVKGIIDDVQRLTGQHFEMLRQEIKDDMNKTREAGMILAVGLATLMIGALLLGITLAHLLHAAFYPNLPLWGAFAIVTGVVLAAGLGLFFAGLKKFQSFNPLPDRTAEALKENVQWLTNPK